MAAQNRDKEGQKHQHGYCAQGARTNQKCIPIQQAENKGSYQSEKQYLERENFEIPARRLVENDLIGKKSPIVEDLVWHSIDPIRRSPKGYSLLSDGVGMNRRESGIKHKCVDQ